MITAVGLLLAIAAVSLFAEPCDANLPLVLAPPHAVRIGAKVLDASFDDWLENLTSLWGMKGLAIAVVRQQPDNTWSVETKGYGVKNAAGDNVTEDVSTSFGAGHLFIDCALAELNESLPFSDNVCHWVKLQALHRSDAGDSC
jgi:hypothetical protein